jgi:protein-S-isoprenylcysteine O-methyltransferase Ste14
MEQLKAWGFSAQSWRGGRGEYWVLVQAIGLIAFVLLPIAPIVTFGTGWAIGSRILAAGLGLGAVGLLVSGVVGLGANLTPLPHPRDESSLVTSGAYRWVRHPIYSGVILGAIAVGLWQWSWSHLLGALVLFIFFDQKARREEVWLADKFTDYDTYRSQVKKLIPGIY